MTYRQFLISFLFLGYIGCHVGFAKNPREVSPSKLGKQFREINKLLLERTDSDDPMLNMKFVEKLILEAEASSFMGIKNKKKLAKAERLFLSLREVGDKEMCNKEGYKIASGNSQAMKKAGLGLNRIREIYTYYLSQQEDACFPICMKMLKDKLAIMDEAKLKRLDYVMMKGMNKDPRGRRGSEGIFALIEMCYVGPSPETLYEILINIPQDISDDLELKKSMKTDDLEHLVVERYLIGPCDHIIAHLAEDIFAPAAMWASIHKPSDNNYEFYWNWAKYKFCGNAYRVIGY